MRYLIGCFAVIAVTTLCLARISSATPEQLDWSRVLPKKTVFPGATFYQVAPFGADGALMSVVYSNGPSLELRVVAHHAIRAATEDVEQWASNRVERYLMRRLPSGATQVDEALSFGERDKYGYVGSVTMVTRKGRYVSKLTLMFRGNAADGTPRHRRHIAASDVKSGEAVLGGINQRLRD